MTPKEQQAMWALMDEANEALRLLREYPEGANIKDKPFGDTIRDIDHFRAAMKRKYKGDIFQEEQVSFAAYCETLLAFQKSPKFAGAEFSVITKEAERFLSLAKEHYDKHMLDLLDLED